MSYKNKKDRKDADIKYKKNNKEKIKIIKKRHYKKLRNEVINGYGGKCNECGIKDKRVLQIDHIYGGGSQERKKKSVRSLLFYLKKNNYPKDKYQILCANCNTIKRIENKENRYKI